MATRTQFYGLTMAVSVIVSVIVAVVVTMIVAVVMPVVMPVVVAMPAVCIGGSSEREASEQEERQLEVFHN